MGACDLMIVTSVKNVILRRLKVPIHKNQPYGVFRSEQYSQRVWNH